MASDLLKQVVRDVGSLRALLVTAMPDCLLYDSWVMDEGAWTAESVASYFGDLVRSNREALKSLGSWSSEMQVTIESADSLVVLREINEHFVAGFIFERSIPLGMVRLHTNRMIDRISADLPEIRAEELPRSVRLISFLQRYAPDPHAVLMRVSVRTGISMDLLRNPQTLDDVQVAKVEDAVKGILGLEQVNV